MKPQNSQINWQKVNRVLVIRLKSIGDTVLTTPSLIALRRFLPEAQIDILLEDWVAPVLDGFEAIDNVISFKKTDLKSRLATAWQLRRNKYDVVFNLHGGTTSGFFVRATSAHYRIGYSHYRYIFFHNRVLSSSADFWNKKTTHSAEQQLALLGFVGIPVNDKPKSKLNITKKAEESVEEKLKPKTQNPKSQIALLHPVAAFDTKQWATENFARIAEYLRQKGFEVIAIATEKEREVLEKLKKLSKVSITAFDDLTLPEITSLSAKAEIFIGNDSGIAHIAAAVKTPSVVIFGSSNRDHWRPWTDAPNVIVYEKFDCQPCAGYFCKQFPEPKCILSVKTESVIEAIEKVLSSKK